MKNGIRILKKISNTCHLPKKSLLTHYSTLLKKFKNLKIYKILFFHLQKTDEKWNPNFQKNFKHLPFVKKNKLLLAHYFTLLKQWSVICFNSRVFFWVISWLLQDALLKMDFQKKLRNSAIFGYSYFKIIRKLLQ